VGPGVRIRLPPAGSLQTFGPSRVAAIEGRRLGPSTACVDGPAFRGASRHNLEQFLDDYLDAAGIREDGKSPLLRSAMGKKAAAHGHGGREGGQRHCLGNIPTCSCMVKSAVVRPATGRVRSNFVAAASRGDGKSHPTDRESESLDFAKLRVTVLAIFLLALLWMLIAVLVAFAVGTVIRFGNSGLPRRRPPF
jgi:hypothetical protein